MKVGDLMRCVYTDAMGIILTNRISNQLVCIHWFRADTSGTVSHPHEQLEVISESR